MIINDKFYFIKIFYFITRIEIENKCWNIQSRVGTKLTYLLKLLLTSIRTY